MYVHDVSRVFAPRIASNAPSRAKALSRPAEAQISNSPTSELPLSSVKPRLERVDREVRARASSSVFERRLRRARAVVRGRATREP